jgi:hypothetical protein
LEGRAFVWFDNFVLSSRDVGRWDEFKKRICIRFGNREDVVEEFNKLTPERGIHREV